jgi:hypothetical protein
MTPPLPECFGKEWPYYNDPNEALARHKLMRIKKQLTRKASLIVGPVCRLQRIPAGAVVGDHWCSISTILT